jgi:hypothetical protein
MLGLGLVAGGNDALEFFLAIERRRIVPGDAQLLELGLRGAEELEIASGSVGSGGSDGEQLFRLAIPLFAEGHLVALGVLELQVVGLVVAIHQHLLIGEMNAPGLLLILLVLLLLGALVLAGRSILLGWTLELLGAGALDLGGLRIFLVRLGLGNLLDGTSVNCVDQKPSLGRLLAFLIPAWPGLRAQDLLGQLPDGSKDGALACGVIA